MKDRILKFLQNENKSYAQFAEEIGVQASGISHILSGRNNPSLDFILKMLSKYQGLSSEWLLFGRGSMYKTVIQPTLFDNEPQNFINIPDATLKNPEILQSERVNPLQYTDEAKADSGKQFQVGQNRVLERVLFIYSDKTFTEYNPS